MIASEFAATGSESTRTFHGLLAGKTGQLGALGSGEAAADQTPIESAAASNASPAVLRTLRLSAPRPAGREHRLRDSRPPSERGGWKG